MKNQEKITQLWELQKKLYTYLIDDEPKINEIIEKYFKLNKIFKPNWFSDSFIFNPLIIAYDELIEKEIGDLNKLKSEIEYIIEDFDFLNQNENINSKINLNELKKEINNLEKDNNNLLYNKNNSISNYSENYYSFEGDQNKYLEIYEKIQYDFNATKEVFEKCVNTLDEFEEEHKTLINELNKTTQEIKKFRTSLDEFQKLGQQIKKHKLILDNREHQLILLRSKLESIKIENEKNLIKLEDKLNDHYQLIDSYNILEEKIKKQQEQQENILNKMINSIELSEESFSNFQKQKMNRDMFLEDLERLKNLINSTEQKFELSILEQEKLLKIRYDKAISIILDKIKIFEHENKQLNYDLESIEKQLEISEKDNIILISYKNNLGFSKFLENISILKNKIESFYSKKDLLISDIEISQINKDDIKSKINLLKENFQFDQLNNLKKKQTLETELELQKSSLKILLEKNNKLITDNQKIQLEIKNLELNASIQQQREFKIKENEYLSLQNRFEELEKLNKDSINEIYNTISSVQENTEKWKLKAINIDLDANNQKKKNQENLDLIKNQINEKINTFKIFKKSKIQIENSIDKINNDINLLKYNLQQKLMDQYKVSMEIEKLKLKKIENINYINNLKQTKIQLLDKIKK